MTIQSDFSNSLLPNESLSDDFPVDLATRKVSFSSEILDGTLNLRLREDQDHFTTIFVTFMPSTNQARVLVTCDGIGKTKQLAAEWNFGNIFGQKSESVGSCQVFIGSRYDLESPFTWSSARLALVKAKEPEMKQKTAIANFVPDFMSFLDRENGIIFHEKDSVIQRFSMQLEKELKATVQIPVDAIFESDDNNEEIIIFSKKSGFFSKTKKRSFASKYLDFFDY